MRLDISLHGIIDPQVGRGRNLADMAMAAARNGATLLQFRAKALDTRAMVEQARALVAALAGTGVPMIVNDRVDVALACGAAGVHLGRQDMHPADARALLGPEAIIGATVKDVADLDALAGQPISYACIGGVFATTHKDNADPGLDLEGFRALRHSARDRLPGMPIGAIAGITVANAGDVIRAGADGVAVIGAMFAGDDVEGDTRALSRAVSGARQGQAYG